VVAQEVYGKVHFLSLEIDKNDPFYKHIQYQKISSVFIQSESRFHYLFENRQIPCFLVQNAPVFRASKKQNSQKKDLIWAGTILERFAVYDCIEMIKEFKEFRLVLKGGGEKNTLRHIHTTYNDLLEQNRLEIDRTYLPENEFIEYLSHFRIGICFYSWELIKSSYNYLTAPSGKLFMYMAAGVPVVACRIPGFQFIEDFGAGVLIDNYDPHTIKDAIMRIEADYEKFSEACYEVADFYDFKKNVMPYVEYLKKSVSNEG
jgi:glycosyltransferase involved in cell wall biosynthesis